MSDLMILIRGARSVALVPGQTQCIDLPPFLDKSDFSRFDLYAQLVTKTRVCHDPERSYLGVRSRSLPAQVDNLLGWQGLLDYASDKVLLPNLKEIGYLDPGYPSSLNWLSVLLSPSVRSVIFTSNDARWPLGSPSHLLANIASKSPNLDELEVYRGKLSAYRIGEDAHWRSTSTYQETFIKGVAAFQKLRRLSGDIALLYPSTLQVLGGLLSLRQLVVYIRGAPPLKYNASLSEDLFPSLRELFITGIESASWVMNLWSIKPLVSRLERIHLCIGPQDPAVSGVDEHWPSEFLLQICDSSPRISNMFIQFSDDDGAEEEISVSASSHVLGALAQLSFKSLSLGNIGFGDRVSSKVLFPAWPNITTLRCGQQSANLADLVDFARNLPHLEILVLDLDMGVSEIPDYSAPSFIPVPRYPAFRCLAREVPKPYKRTRSQTLKLAKYLHYLWPNVHCACCFYDGVGEIEPGDYGSPWTPAEKGQRELERLDANIQKLRLKSEVSQ